MKKKLYVLLLAVVCLLVFTGCFCEHEWAPADCVNPSTCTKCGKTEGEALGHVWLAATCEEPKTCEVCGVTEGEAKGHSWVEATCTAPKTCERCGETEGEAPGHTWVDATTEAPKTCSTCGETEGERIITDSRFTTASAASLLGKWGCEMALTGADMGIEDFTGELKCMLVLNFGPAGDLTFGIQITNQEDFIEAMVTYTVDTMYAEFAAQGVDKATAEAAMQATYGMGVEEYARSSMEGVDFNTLYDSLFSALGIGGVYYVDGDQLYVGTTWEGEMEPTAYAIENGTLTIDSFSAELGVDGGLVRIEE